MQTLALLACLIAAPVDDADATPPPPPPAPLNRDAAIIDAARAAQQAAAAAEAAAQALQRLTAPTEAADPKAADAKQWSYATSFSVQQVGGNASTLSAGVDARALGKWRDWGTEFIGSVNYGQTKVDGGDRVTAERGLLTAKGERILDPTLSTYALLGFVFDHIADIDNQEYGEPGLTLTWFNNAMPDYVRSALRTSIGFRATREYRAHFYDSGLKSPRRTVLGPDPALRWFYAPVATLNFRFGFSRHAFFTEDASVLFDVVETKNVRASSDTALSAQLNDQLALSLNFKLRYIGQPAQGKQTTDSILGASLTWNF